MDERSRYVKLESKEKSPTRPTFFLCRGTSGAGLTTAINAMIEEGLAVRAPAQFVTRRLRANEKKGEQYHSVTQEILDKIHQQIALEDTLYGNIYGFFYPAIERMKKILIRENVIIDALNTPEEWGKVLGNEKPIVSIFFSPNHPRISIERIMTRAKQNGDLLTREELVKRASDNTKNIKAIWDSDYWLDTTEFDLIFHRLKSVILYHSFNLPLSSEVDRIEQNSDKIKRLVENFSCDTIPYIEELYRQ